MAKGGDPPPLSWNKLWTTVKKAMLKTIQNATFRRSTVPFLRGAPRLSARRLSLSMPIIDVRK